MAQYFPAPRSPCDARARSSSTKPKPSTLRRSGRFRHAIQLSTPDDQRDGSLHNESSTCAWPPAAFSSSLSEIDLAAGPWGLPRQRSLKLAGKTSDPLLLRRMSIRRSVARRRDRHNVFKQPGKNVVARFSHELTSSGPTLDCHDAIIHRDDYFLGWSSLDGLESADSPSTQRIRYPQ